MSVDVLAYLHSKGIHTKQAGANNIHCACFFCAEDSGARGRLYVNVDPSADIPGLYHCLAGETEVITWNGIRTIKELAGDTHRIMTVGGQWVDAPFYSFGEQRLLRVTLARNGVERVVYATPEHRWFKRKGAKRRADGSRTTGNVELTTEHLKPGHRLAYAFGQGCKGVRPSPFGVAHGVVFGDGTRVHTGCCVNLHGAKDAELERYFNGCPTTVQDGHIRVADLPAFFKVMPPLDESRSYLYGFLAGYIAADGTVTKDGQVILWSADSEALRAVELLCLRIGVGTYGVRGPFERTGQATNFGDRPLYSLGFIRETLTPDLLVLQEHRRRFEAATPAYSRKGWVVRSVVDDGRDDEVFCAVVPGTESFVLAGNVLTGNCKLCDARGSLVSLKKHFGDNDKITARDENDAAKRQILDFAATYYTAALSERPESIRWLKEQRCLSIETIMAHRLGFADGDLRHHLSEAGFKTHDMVATGLVTEQGRDFFRDEITIPYLANGNVVMIRGKDPAGKYRTPSGNKARLFNVDYAWERDEVLITEGEFDAMVCEQLGFAAIGVPGANAWQDGWDDYFSQTRRIYIALDPDDVGRRAAEKLRARLAPRSRVIDLPVPDDAEAKEVDPSWLMQKGLLTTELITDLMTKSSGSLLITADEAFAARAEMELLSGIKFGVPELDDFIAPGLLPSQVMVLLARSGVGKTIMCLNLMQLMAMEQPDLKFFFVSLEQTRAEWAERARRIHRFYNLDSDDAGAADFWRERLLIVDRNRINEDVLLALLDEYEYEMGKGPDVIFLDYLGYWAQSFRGERYDRTSDSMMALKAIAKERKVAIITPHQVSRGASPGEEPSPDDARDSGVILETSDFLLTLWNPDGIIGSQPDEHLGEVHCRISKSRHGGAGQSFKYQLAPTTLVMVPTTEKLQHRAEQELLDYKNAPRHRRLTWEEAIENHREAEAVARSAAIHQERMPYSDPEDF